MEQPKEESKKKKSSNHLKEANAWVKKYREKHPNVNQAKATKLYWEKKKKGESLSLYYQLIFFDSSCPAAF